eukprot:1196073-Rhodomonas_salina.1
MFLTRGRCPAALEHGCRRNASSSDRRTCPRTCGIGDPHAAVKLAGDAKRQRRRPRLRRPGMQFKFAFPVVARARQRGMC